MELWPLIGRAEFAVQNVDPDSESALESAGRCAFLLGGLDIPQSNVWLGFERPMLRVDHYWASAGLVVEADGMGKYAIGGDPMASLRTEKDREHLLRTWALRLLRYGWRRAMYEQDVLVEQVRTALLEPPIGPIPGLRTWPAAEGYRILGMPYPRRRPAA